MCDRVYACVVLCCPQELVMGQWPGPCLVWKWCGCLWCGWLQAGMTPLLVGCEVASKRMVQTLIEAGSPVNVVAMVSGGVSVRCHVRRVCVK